MFDAANRNGTTIRQIFASVGTPAGGDGSPEIESILHARKGVHYMTVEMTVDRNMSEQNARFYAGLQAQEMIEWE